MILGMPGRAPGKLQRVAYALTQEQAQFAPLITPQRDVIDSHIAVYMHDYEAVQICPIRAHDQVIGENNSVHIYYYHLE